jgi:hypothetical protein
LVWTSSIDDAAQPRGDWAAICATKYGDQHGKVANAASIQEHLVATTG